MPTLFKKREDKHSVDGGSPDSQQTDVEASKGTPPEKAAFFMKSLPSKRDLTEQLHVTANVLDVARKETYQKKFRLWMPMIHTFNENDNDEEENMVELLPVDELLDRVMLKRVRIAAVERSLVFLFFLFVYCGALYLQRSLADSYELEAALKKQIESGDVKFSEIEKVDDIWTWMESSLMQSVIPGDTWYNGEPLEAADQGYSFFYQKQCGGFSLVQHRVKESRSEAYTPDFVRLYPTVWPNLGGETSTKNDIGSGDDRDPFGPDHDPLKYVWTPDSAGEFEGGGYMVQFPTKQQKVRYLIEELKADRFIDKKTRKLMFIVTKFNANLRLFAVIQFQVTINAAGDVSTKTALRSVRVNQFVNARDFARIIFEAGSIFLMVMQSFQELETLFTVGFRAYVNFWNLVDGARQCMFYYSIIAYVTLMSDNLRQNPQAVETMCNGGEWQNFPKVAKLEDDYVFVSALTLLVSTLLIFKFLTPFPKIGIFVHTMVSAGGDLLNFTAVLSILLFGYAIMGHLLFGHVLENYSTVTHAMESAIFFSIGDVDYESLVAASSYAAAAIYFYSFLFIITIIVMQMVIAIIFNAYDGLRELINVSEELAVQPVLLRKLVLGREPSISETNMAIFDLIKRQLFRMHQFLRDPFSKRVAPLSQTGGGKNLDAENFSDDDLLNLFDAQHVFRVYGILSPALEDEIVSVKQLVATQRATEDAASGMSPTQIAYELEQRNSAIDPWALDTREFCALLHALDENDDQVNVDDRTELEIAQNIFNAYGRSRASKLGGRANLVQRLDGLSKDLNGKFNDVLKAINKDGGNSNTGTPLGSFDVQPPSPKKDKLSVTASGKEKALLDSAKDKALAKLKAVSLLVKNNVAVAKSRAETRTEATGYFGGAMDRAALEATAARAQERKIGDVTGLRKMRRGQSIAILSNKASKKAEASAFLEEISDEEDEDGDGAYM